MNVTDEMLMAYADGELSREDCRLLEGMLAQDGSLRARLEPFAVTGSSLAGVFEQPMREPIPDRLLAVITAGSRNKSAPAGRKAGRAPRQSTGFLDAVAEALFPSGLGLAGAFSLTALFAAGGAAGYLASRVTPPAGGGNAVVALDHGSLVAGSELKIALETQASVDDKTALQNGAALWPAQSFKSKDGFCREYKIAGDGEKSYAGIACRSADSQWRVAVHAQAKAISAKDFALLESAESPAVEAVVENIRQGDVFGSEEEAAAIAKGWSVTK
jgi:hypothetical protein